MGVLVMSKKEKKKQARAIELEERKKQAPLIHEEISRIRIEVKEALAKNDPAKAKELTMQIAALRSQL